MQPLELSPTLLTHLSALSMTYNSCLSCDSPQSGQSPTQPLEPRFHGPVVKTWSTALEDMAAQCSVISQNCVCTTSPDTTLNLGREKEGHPSPEFPVSAKASHLGVVEKLLNGDTMGPWGSTYL